MTVGKSKSDAEFGAHVSNKSFFYVSIDLHSKLKCKYSKVINCKIIDTIGLHLLPPGDPVPSGSFPLGRPLGLRFAFV